MVSPDDPHQEFSTYRFLDKVYSTLLGHVWLANFVKIKKKVKKTYKFFFTVPTIKGCWIEIEYKYNFFMLYYFTKFCVLDKIK